MPDDLTARLRQALPEQVECGTDSYSVYEPLTDEERDRIAASLTEVVESYVLAAVMSRQAPAEKERDDALISYTKMFNRAEKAERERDEARRELTLAKRELRNLMDERDIACRQRGEAVRLLKEYPIPVPGDQYSRYSQYHAASEVWERKRATFLARHQEARRG